MDLAPDTTKVTNPARTAAKEALATAERTLGGLESALATTATRPGGDLAAANATLARLSARIEGARTELEAAGANLKAIPAKVPADSLDPNATRATPRTNRRAMQMVCRLLAYNAELDLARALNAYLADPDEYRAITRHLLHQPGTITYRPSTITVTLRPPDAPRIARTCLAGCLV